MRTSWIATRPERAPRVADHYGLDIDDETLKARAIEWSATRGARSGRVAIQLVRTLAGELGKAI